MLCHESLRGAHAALKFDLNKPDLNSNTMNMDAKVARQYKTTAAMAGGIATSTNVTTKTTKTVTG